MDERPEAVETMREVPRPPEHCGKPMRKLVSPNGTIQYSCGCGHQEKGGSVVPAKAKA